MARVESRTLTIKIDKSAVESLKAVVAHYKAVVEEAEKANLALSDAVTKLQEAIQIDSPHQ